MNNEFILELKDVDPLKVAKLAEHMQGCLICHPSREVNDWCFEGGLLFMTVIATARKWLDEHSQDSLKREPGPPFHMC